MDLLSFSLNFPFKIGDAILPHNLSPGGLIGGRLSMKLRSHYAPSSITNLTKIASHGENRSRPPELTFVFIKGPYWQGKKRFIPHKVQM